MRTMRITAVIAAVSALTTNAAAQDWPVRPVIMVAPTAAAGGPDIIGRMLAPRLSELLGQQVIVENVPGAGGMIGSARVAKARPDGYQFVIGNVGTHAQSQSLHKSPLYDAAIDFAPVILLAEIQFILTARKDLPVENLPEFIAYAKANQGKMRYGTAGPGSPPHLVCGLFNAAIGIDVSHVPYRGMGPATQDLIAGRVDYLCASATTAIGPIENKQAKALAIFSRARSPLMPDYMTAYEQGLSGFQATGWIGLFMPKGTPTPIITKLNTVADAALDTPAVRARFRDIGADIVAPERRSPRHFQEFVESEIAKWATAIKAAGLSVQ
jgi:tripartite-type tricarboxylate transporter receptor subunit TctC